MATEGRTVNSPATRRWLRSAEETFAAFEPRFPAPMPWFSRTMSSWIADFAEARLAVTAKEEPLHPETRRPLSLILIAREDVGA